MLEYRRGEGGARAVNISIEREGVVSVRDATGRVLYAQNIGPSLLSGWGQGKAERYADAIRGDEDGMGAAIVNVGRELGGTVVLPLTVEITGKWTIGVEP